MRNKICVFIITLLSLCSGLPAQTQPGKLSGVIIDTNDEEILPGANIYIEALKRGVSADKNGSSSSKLLRDVIRSLFRLWDITPGKRK